MKLNLGSHGDNIPGFINIDLHDPSADLKCDVSNLPYADGTVEHIYASHILEHFLSGDYERHLSANINKKTVKEVLTEWKRVLKYDGLLEIKVPDFEKVVWLYNNYPQWAKSPGGNDPFPAAFDWLVSNGQHAAIFDRRTMYIILQSLNFREINFIDIPVQAKIDRRVLEMHVTCRR